jgi:hypothetical protein
MYITRAYLHSIRDGNRGSGVLECVECRRDTPLANKWGMFILTIGYRTFFRRDICHNIMVRAGSCSAAVGHLRILNVALQGLGLRANFHLLCLGNVQSRHLPFILGI